MSNVSESATPRVAYLTAGAAGMFCGSCMRDNTLAAALVRLGVDIQLIPTYTPLRTDEENVAIDKIFFGGINVYLQNKSSFSAFSPAGWTVCLIAPGSSIGLRRAGCRRRLAIWVI